MVSPPCADQNTTTPLEKETQDIGSCYQDVPGTMGQALEAFTLQTLAFQLARTTDGFSVFTRALFRRLFIVAAQLHFPEDAFALHLLLEGFQGLVDIIVTNENLHVTTRLL